MPPRSRRFFLELVMPEETYAQFLEGLKVALASERAAITALEEIVEREGKKGDHLDPRIVAALLKATAASLQAAKVTATRIWPLARPEEAEDMRECLNHVREIHYAGAAITVQTGELLIDYSRRVAEEGEKN